MCDSQKKRGESERGKNRPKAHAWFSDESWWV